MKFGTIRMPSTRFRFKTQIFVCRALREAEEDLEGKENRYSRAYLFLNIARFNISTIDYLSIF